MSLTEVPIIQLDFIDSTNNYAMQLIDGNKAQPGMTIVAKAQTNGKGQRGKSWIDAPGESLLMSVIVSPKHQLTEQFLFNASITAAIANVLQKLHKGWQINIKWPNDIIVNDKKAGGVLIENVLRGNSWTHSVVGLGLNINQESFPAELPFATSLKIASGQSFDINEVMLLIRDQILENIAHPMADKELVDSYNRLLFKRGRQQVFMDATGKWQATVLNALPNGTLEVQLDSGDIVHYHHGQILWDYGQ